MRGMRTNGMDFETANLRDIKEAGYETPMGRLQRNACFDKEAAIEHQIPGTNLSISGFGRDMNGNSLVYINTPNQRRKSIQTNSQGLMQTYNAGREGMDFFNSADPDKIAKVEKEILDYVQQFGTPSVKDHLKMDKGGAKKTASEEIEDEQEFIEEEPEIEEPTEGDYVLSDSGPLGSKTSVSEVGGAFLGEFSSNEEVDAFIKERMEKEQFWPSVWYMSDHGNVEPYTITAAKTAGVPEQHQLRILRDTVKNPAKGMFLGGPTAEEAEKTLKEEFGYTDEQIKKLKASKKTAGILADIMNGQNRIPTKNGEKTIMGVSAIIHNNMPVEEIADVLMNGEQRMRTLRGEKSVKGVVDMLKADREANPNSYVPIVGVEAEKKTASEIAFDWNALDYKARVALLQSSGLSQSYATKDIGALPEEVISQLKNTVSKEREINKIDPAPVKTSNNKTAAIYDGYGYRVTIEAKAGDYNESYTPITGMLASADIRYREVKRYTIDPDRMLLDILITKDDIEIIQGLNKQSKETGITFTFNDNISEAIKPKQIVTEDAELKNDKPVTAGKKVVALRSTENDSDIKAEILGAFMDSPQAGDLDIEKTEAFFEHGQWFIKCQLAEGSDRDEVSFSVVDVDINGEDRFDFEEL